MTDNSTTKHKTFTEEQLINLVQWRDAGAHWQWIADNIGVVTSEASVRRAYDKHHREITNKTTPADSSLIVETLKRNRTLIQKNSEKSRAANYILDYTNQQDKLLDKLELYLADTKFNYSPTRQQKSTKKKSDDRRGMTVEIMYTDVHMGKLGDGFNRQVCIDRTKKYIDVTLAEIERKLEHYYLDKIVLFLGGDNIENANIHGAESAKGCEAPTPDQILWYIDNVFTNIILPLSTLSVPVEVVCIAGNHDRQDERKTFHYPGYDSEAWVMYNVLQQMTRWAGIKNYTWHIPKGIYHVLDIYGNKILYEHGDHVDGLSRRSLITHLHKRSQQVGELIDGIRFGHWHEHLAVDEGRVVVNASVCGVDSYADVKGFSSRAGQVLNFYVDTKNRRNKFFHSLLVQLED